MEPRFFATPDEFRAWLVEHHASERELLVGFHKTSSGRPSITWPESVDQALSVVNVTRARELIALGLMRPAGLAAFERRADDRTAMYSYEQRKEAKLEPEQQRWLEANADAWSWFQAQTPSYRRAAIHWVTSAKRPETRERRLQLLIDDSAATRPVPPLRADRRATRS